MGTEGPTAATAGSGESISEGGVGGCGEGVGGLKLGGFRRSWRRNSPPLGGGASPPRAFIEENYGTLTLDLEVFIDYFGFRIDRISVTRFFSFD